VTRIVGGSRGGRRIATPAGQDTRPTSDRVREALFASLQSDVDIAGCRFSDLYAGSGAVGLEAASRGAADVWLVESDVRAARSARENIDALQLGAVCRLTVGRVARALTGPADRAYDAVFADPPYALGEPEISTMLAALVDGGWLTRHAVVVLERASRSPEPAWPPGLHPARARRYGDTMLWYARAAPGP
jgi:16S rRNA (guanine966-N2)-methyltransferase